MNRKRCLRFLPCHAFQWCSSKIHCRRVLEVSKENHFLSRNLLKFCSFCLVMMVTIRFEPYLKNACKRFVMELSSTFISDDNPNKVINIAFFNIPFSLMYLSTSSLYFLHWYFWVCFWSIFSLIFDDFVDGF